MRPGIAKSTLKDILAIRDAQRSAAEAQALRASVTVRSKRVSLEKSEQERFASEERWTRIASLTPLELEILRLCAGDVLQRESAVIKAEAEVERALQDCERNVGEWSAAVRRHDLANRLLRSAQRAEANRRDEVVVQAALDRHAWRDGNC